YVKWGDEFISIPKGEDPGSVGIDRAIQLIEEKLKADAPVAFYNDKPITKGKGRFGPYIKYDGMFINVPKRYNFDELTQAEMNELIDAKIIKESNRYIQRWPDEKIALENGRWGPFIRFGKKMLKLPKKADETKYTAEEIKDIPLEEIKKMIEAQMPGAFGKKKTAKKAPAKKPARPKGGKAVPKKKKKEE
ncbi:MAG: DNA topoisomerase I, partial [Bacteroidia bacterium]|nr:DNA topoisomerase I [Bacteroidia bacterium]